MTRQRGYVDWGFVAFVTFVLFVLSLLAIGTFRDLERKKEFMDECTQHHAFYICTAMWRR